jgi:hypothetical protein
MARHVQSQMPGNKALVSVSLGSSSLTSLHNNVTRESGPGGSQSGSKQCPVDLQNAPLDFT